MAIDTQLSLYAQKLKDPRWQKKRLEIFTRDEWTCQLCSNTKDTLVVHHRLYFPDTEPWNYPNDLLVTLCESCHSRESANRTIDEDNLLLVLRKQFYSSMVASLSSCLGMVHYSGDIIIESIIFDRLFNNSHHRFIVKVIK